LPRSSREVGDVTERLLTARELGELLCLSTGTVLDRFERGDLPGFRLYGGRVGAPVRFRWSEVNAWLERGRCGPTPVASNRYSLTSTPVHEKLHR
jgi:predicted DNA-binding transcriptional regulator AlpA